MTHKNTEMNYSEKELDSQGKEIRNKVLIVLIPIAIMIIIISIIQSNSLEHNRRIYFESKNIEYGGKIIGKHEDGDYPRANRFLKLNSGRDVRVSNNIYYKIKIGDSLSKRKNKDSTYFYLKTGEILFEDNNKFERERYEKLLEKQKPN
jgi:hypothetical protein